MNNSEIIEAALAALREVEQVVEDNEKLESEFAGDLANAISMVGRISDELEYGEASYEVAVELEDEVSQVPQVHLGPSL